MGWIIGFMFNSTINERDAETQKVKTYLDKLFGGKVRYPLTFMINIGASKIKFQKIGQTKEIDWLTACQELAKQPNYEKIQDIAGVLNTLQYKYYGHHKFLHNKIPWAHENWVKYMNEKYPNYSIGTLMAKYSEVFTESKGWRFF